MANKTIYGCVDGTTVTFQGEACDSGDYTGCIVTSGTYEGMVAVTISEAFCDDTYYGCVNWTTGKFQLTIPRTCCYEYDCEACDAQPGTVRVVISNVVDCTECNGPYMEGEQWIKYTAPSDIAGTYDLPIISECMWREEFVPGGNVAEASDYGDSDCTSPLGNSFTWDEIRVTVYQIPASPWSWIVRLELQDSNNPGWRTIINTIYVPDTDCVGKTGIDVSYTCPTTGAIRPQSSLTIDITEL